MKLATLLTFASLATTITSQDFTSANDEEISICETNVRYHHLDRICIDKDTASLTMD